MAVSRVNSPALRSVEEVNTQTNQDSRHPSPLPASPQGLTGQNTVDPKHARAQRGNLMAQIERAWNGRKVHGSSLKENTGATWNTGLMLACSLVQALASSPDNRDGSADSALHEFEKMIRPLTTQAQVITPADFLAHVIEQLQASGSPGQNADLLKTLEDLKADTEHVNALGFYVVMTVMAAAAGIAQSMRIMRVDDACTSVRKRVELFLQHIDKRLENICATKSPQVEKLIVMAKAAMKVPFSYSCFLGKGMPASLTHSMLNWSRTVAKTETKSLQAQLEAALGSFIDAWMSTPEPGSEDQDSVTLNKLKSKL